MLLRKDDHVLFLGDSITDAGRRAGGNPGNHLGAGYVAMVAESLLGRYGELNLRFTNRGIGGNRVYDLETRLQGDVIDLRPTVVSILVGINDTWRRFDRNMVSPTDEFHATYQRICRRIVDELGARLVICEPFLLPTPPDREAWRVDLDPRIAAVRRIGAEFAAVYVPLDGVFAAAARRRPAEFWAGDGVHPTPAGHELIAEAWIKAVCS